MVEICSNGYHHVFTYDSDQHAAPKNFRFSLLSDQLSQFLLINIKEVTI